MNYITFMISTKYFPKKPILKFDCDFMFKPIGPIPYGPYKAILPTQVTNDQFP